MAFLVECHFLFRCVPIECMYVGSLLLVCMVEAWAYIDKPNSAASFVEFECVGDRRRSWHEVGLQNSARPHAAVRQP
jgi:hypothetical protein